MVSHWLGWISFACCIFLSLKIIGRLSKINKFNLFLRKFHQPLGIAVMFFGTIHGILCFIKNQKAIISIVSGLILLFVIIALARTYFSRKKLKAKWFKMHRHLTFFLILLLIIHILSSL